MSVYACRELRGYLPAANSPVGHARLFLYLIFGDALLQQLLDLAACLLRVCFACNNGSASLSGAEAWPRIRTHPYDSDANVSVTGTVVQSDRKHGFGLSRASIFRPPT